MRRIFTGSLLGAALLLGAQAGWAQTASVTISAPKDGARLDAMASHELVYEVTPGPKGNHVHLYVDDKEAAVLRQLKGSYTLAKLAPGEHNLCVKVVDRAHAPIGVQGCVKVSVQ